VILIIRYNRCEKSFKHKILILAIRRSNWNIKFILEIIYCTSSELKNCMQLNLESVLFFSLAVLSIGSAIMMITRRSPISSALFLILNFFTVSGLYLLLRAQFIAIIQVLVYMGAIMVLFLFVIMLLNLQDESKLTEKFSYKKITAVLLSIFLLCLLGFTIYFGFEGKFKTMSDKALTLGTAETLGAELFTNYSFPFELASFLLLAAIVGAVVLAKKKFD